MAKRKTKAKGKTKPTKAETKQAKREAKRAAKPAKQQNATTLGKLKAGALFVTKGSKLWYLLEGREKKTRLARPLSLKGGKDQALPNSTDVQALRVIPSHAGALPVDPTKRQALTMEIAALVLRTTEGGPFVTAAAIIQHIERTS